MTLSILSPVPAGYGYAAQAPQPAGSSPSVPRRVGLSSPSQIPEQSPPDQESADSAAAPRPVQESGEPADGREQPGGGQPGDAGGGPTAGIMARLTPGQQAKVRQLQQRDREVKAHEQAHMAAGGRYVRGGAHYQYQTGPDGRQYAVGGEVSIDSGEESSPQATIIKARAIRRAALAPAQPSSQDRQVAAKASAMERQARAELAKQQQAEAELAGAWAGQQADRQSPSASTGAANDPFPRPRADGPPPLSARLGSLNIQV